MRNAATEEFLDDTRIALQARHDALKTYLQLAHHAIKKPLRDKYITALGGLNDAIRLLGEKE